MDHARFARVSTHYYAHPKNPLAHHAVVAVKIFQLSNINLFRGLFPGECTRKQENDY